MKQDLTIEAVLNMEAGRELDEIIAERIFNFKDFYWSGGERHYGPQYQYNVLPYYSADIKAAWKVEEQILDFHLTSCYSYWLSKIVRSDMTIIAPSFYAAHAAPVDRCKAALIAVIKGVSHE